MINNQIRNLKNDLVRITNECTLPIEIKRLVFSEIMSQIDIECEKVLILERQKAQEEKKEDENNE